MSNGEAWRLGYRPALDGLRGIAVALVVLSHVLRVHPPGTVGVAIFFTLSGFLITTLLLEEYQRHERIQLLDFYRRRALRLFPALGAVTLLAVAVGWASRDAVMATLFYVANWYAAAGGDLGVLTHTWSLGIEEQFYLAWPIVLVIGVRFGRRRLMWIAVVAALASATARILMYGAGADGGSVVRWTHTRADGLLIGCIVALLLHGLPNIQGPQRLTNLGMCALMLCSFLPPSWGYTFVPTAVALITAVVIYATVSSDYSQWLTSDRLVYLGQRSYGLYLWHVPVLVAATRMGMSPVMTALVAVFGSWGVTLLSWSYIEQPFLRLKRSASVSNAPRSQISEDQRGSSASVPLKECLDGPG